MAEFTRFFDLLYTRFLLRDIVAKIVPALLLALVLFHALGVSREDVQRYLDLFVPIIQKSSVFAVVFAGLLYAIGFTVGMLLQNLGELFRLVMIQPWNGPHGRLEDSLDVARIFLGVTKDNDRALQQRERFILLKEMTGNLTVVFCIAVLVPVVKFVVNKDVPDTWFLIFCVSLSLIAFMGNRYHLGQQRIWEKLYTRTDTETKQIVGAVFPRHNTAFF